jgi:PrtD family type I secretion system ABC transporter
MSMRDRRGRNTETDLDLAVSQCGQAFGSLVLFSLAINLLTLASPLYMLQVYDRVMVTGNVDTLLMLTIMAAAALLLFGMLDSIRSMLTTRISIWLADCLGPVYLANSVRSRLLGDGSGAQPLRDLQQVQTLISSPALGVIFDAPWAPVYLALIWMLHPALGTLAIVSTAILLLLGLANEAITRRALQTANQAQIVATMQAETTIRNAEVVSAMGMLPALTTHWRQANSVGLRASKRASDRGALILGFTKFARLFMQSAILGLGAYLVLKGQVSGGVMIASSILLGRALAPVEMAMATWRNFSAARIAYDRLKTRLQSLPDEPRRTSLPAPEGHLSIQRVTYSPPGGTAPVLYGLNFEAIPGEAIAVIGPSASGKSSLCRLLVGVAQPAGGVIRLDGSDLRHWNPDELGPHIGYLPQEPELFPGTIRDNIARMNCVDEAAVIRAAMLAHAHEMIQLLPNGYDTPIGDGGLRLSGGQRQRIGLARAVYGDPKVIVLDEPNANLDQAGEAALSAAIEEMKGRGATLLIVGHRPSTIAQADKILLLRDGRIEAFGSRDEILKRLRVAASEPPAPEKVQSETERQERLTAEAAE